MPKSGRHFSGTALARTSRTWSGVVLLAYITSHLVNHALGLISLEAMEAGRGWFLALWRNPPGTVLLYGSLSVHMALALYALYARRTLRMRAWEAAQLLLGLAIPVFLAEHIIGTRILHEIYGATDAYAYTLLVFFVFVPEKGVAQAALLVIAWLHGCIGLHFWLRLRPWYPRLAPALYAAALLVPVLALLGYVQAGREVAALAADPAWRREIMAALHWPGREAIAFANAATAASRYGLLAAVAAVLAARAARAWWKRRQGVVRLTYPPGRPVESAPGLTVLEASRRAGSPPASVCGGRGRCSTCRVRVGAGAEHLAAPSAEEARVLTRVGAPPNVRLACQIRPTAALEVTPLLPPTATARDARARPDYLQGREREIAVLFADLRAFTRFAENRLPYDVVFVLNRYFDAMGRAVEETGGHLDKFIGDGVMALFGVSGGPAEACRDALACARAMSEKLGELNASLAHDLDEPLKIGIGIHAGPAIIGEMGYGAATHLTAVGDTVNTASRLEALTKEFGAELVLSEAVAARAGADLSSYPAREVEIRGRREALAVRLVADAGALAPATSS